MNVTVTIILINIAFKNKQKLRTLLLFMELPFAQLDTKHKYASLIVGFTGFPAKAKKQEPVKMSRVREQATRPRAQSCL